MLWRPHSDKLLCLGQQKHQQVTLRYFMWAGQPIARFIRALSEWVYSGLHTQHIISALVGWRDAMVLF